MTERVRDAVEATGPFGPVAFVLLYVALTVALVPGTIPSLAAGALFGAVLGSLLTLLGATLGAVAAFELARRLGRARVHRRMGDRLTRLDGWMGRQGLTGVLTLRLFPVAPFNALNYAFGLSAVTRRDHLVGTAIGIVPGTVAFVALGSSLGDPGSPAFLGALAAVGALVALSAVRAGRRRPPAQAADGELRPGSPPPRDPRP